jgi:hypothetical protein
MANVSISALKDALNQVRYPTHKYDLVRHAEQSNAPEDVQKALRTLPPVDYGNCDEVIRSVTPEVGSGPTDERRSNPGKGTHRSGTAQFPR